MLGFGNQYRTNDASAVAVFCADLEPSKRIDRIYDLERNSGMRPEGYLAVLRVAASFLTGDESTSSAGSTTNNNAIMNVATTSNGKEGGNNTSSSTHLSTFLKQTFADALSPVQPMPTMENTQAWSYKNAGILAQTYTMAATAHGLSTCMMEGYDARRVKEILRIPPRYGVPLMVATGYDYGVEQPVLHADLEEDDDDGDHALKIEKRTARLEMDELYFGDTFGEPLDLLRDDTSRYAT